MISSPTIRSVPPVSGKRPSRRGGNLVRLPFHRTDLFSFCASPRTAPRRSAPQRNATIFCQFTAATQRFASPRSASLRNATLFFKSPHDISRNFTNRNQSVRFPAAGIARAGSLPDSPALPSAQVNHVCHSVSSVSLGRTCETKGRPFAWVQKGFAKS